MLDDVRAVARAMVCIGTPGRVYHLLSDDALSARELRMLVIDEADEMLSLGFKDQVRFIGLNFSIFVR